MITLLIQKCCKHSSLQAFTSFINEPKLKNQNTTKQNETKDGLSTSITIILTQV